MDVGQRNEAPRLKRPVLLIGQFNLKSAFNFGNCRTDTERKDKAMKKFKMKSRTGIPVPRSCGTDEKIISAEKHFKNNINIFAILENAKREYRKIFGHD